MTWLRPSRMVLAALRRERLPFAVLATLLLAVQLFLAGLSGAAMAADRRGPHSAVFCIGGVAGPQAPEPRDHHTECPCLAGACLQALALVPPDSAAGGEVPCPAAAERPSVKQSTDEPDRRPLRLFARASRGPPALS